MKKLTSLIAALLLVMLMAGCGTAPGTSPSGSPGAASESPAPATELTISAAASLSKPLDEIIANYAAVAPNVKITVNYGGSGALQTQIENGAPTDIFISAAAKQMDALDSKGLLVSGSVVKLLKNEIVLVVPAGSTLELSKFDDAAGAAVKKIALGDAASVPAGQYAQETFTALGLWDAVSAKAVFGSDVKQVLSWVSSGDADCGVVYATDAVSNSAVKVIAPAPDGTHKDVVYPAGLVKAGSQQAAAAEFLKYLQSDAAMDVFTKNGFLKAE